MTGRAHQQHLGLSWREISVIFGVHRTSAYRWRDEPTKAFLAWSSERRARLVAENKVAELQVLNLNLQRELTIARSRVK